MGEEADGGAPAEEGAGRAGGQGWGRGRGISARLLGGGHGEDGGEEAAELVLVQGVVPHWESSPGLGFWGRTSFWSLWEKGEKGGGRNLVGDIGNEGKNGMNE